jgi:hypothetical protein
VVFPMTRLSPASPKAFTPGLINHLTILTLLITVLTLLPYETSETY